MSERQRVLFALQGKRFPREGEIGLYTGRERIERISQLGVCFPDSARVYARVEVVRLSPTGQTLWTRFLTDVARARWGTDVHRWWRYPNEHYRVVVEGNEVLYAAGFDAKRAPQGEVSFPRVGSWLVVPKDAL